MTRFLLLTCVVFLNSYLPGGTVGAPGGLLNFFYISGSVYMLLAGCEPERYVPTVAIISRKFTPFILIELE